MYGRIHSFLVAIILMYKNMMNKMNDNDDGDKIEEADDDEVVDDLDEDGDAYGDDDDGDDDDGDDDRDDGGEIHQRSAASAPPGSSHTAIH